jgi:hypothetical protein
VLQECCGRLSLAAEAWHGLQGVLTQWFGPQRMHPLHGTYVMVLPVSMIALKRCGGVPSSSVA